MKVKLFEEFNKGVIGYHVSETKNDDKILSKGIVSKQREIYRYGKKEISPVRNYFWLDLEYAEWFKEFHKDHNKEMTMWKVNLTGYKLHRDLETEDMSDWSSQFDKGEDGKGVYIEENIPPSRIIYNGHVR